MMAIAPKSKSTQPQAVDWPWLSVVNAAVLYIDNELNIRICNDQAANLFSSSLTSGDVLPLQQCLPCERDEFHVLASIALERRVVRDTVAVWEADGRMRHVLIDSFLNHSCDLSLDNADDGVVILIKDLGNFVTLEQQVQRHEKLATVGKVAAGVAHEIRNPLTTIKGFLQMLTSRCEAGPAVVEQQYIDVMLDEINRVDNLVTELLLLSRPVQVAYMSMDMLKLLQDVYTHIEADASRYGIDVQLEVEEVQPIVGDPQLLRQVFLNLADNALEAMEEGGTLTLRLTTHEVGICVDVADTGPGIPYYQTDRIFDAFFTTKASGIGLGLPICQRIIEDHNGEIRVSSKGFGTTFTVLLPLSTDSQHNHAPSA